MDSDDRQTNDPDGTAAPDDPSASDAERPRRRRNRWALLIAILGLVIVVASGYLMYTVLTDEPSPPSAQVTVPDLVGITLADARLIVRALGLQLVPTGQVSDQPITTVLAQEPSPGTIVAQGSEIGVTIATGADTVTVPDLHGLLEANAVAQLAQAGLTAGERTDAFHEAVDVGSIAAQQPASGTQVPRGTPISYVVSRGPAPLPSGGPSPSPSSSPRPSAPPAGGGLKIGDYRCLTLADATRHVKADGFALGTVTYTFEGGPVDASWVVSTQAPAPGARRPGGTKVDLLLTNPTFICR